MPQAEWPSDRQVWETIGPRLRKARKAIGLLQKEIASGCGVSESVQSRYENSKMAPSWAYLYRLEKIFGITASYLITGSAKGMRKKER